MNEMNMKWTVDERGRIVLESNLSHVVLKIDHPARAEELVKAHNRELLLKPFLMYLH